MFHKLFTTPLRAVIALAEKIRDEVDKEMYSIPYIQQQLVLLYTKQEMQEIEEAPFLEQERELLHRLEVAKEREWEQFLNENDTDNE